MSLVIEKFAEKLADVMNRATRTCTNETELRLCVEPAIREALLHLYKLKLESIRSERIIETGRFDTAYGGVVVEYEWMMTSLPKKRHGAAQALSYLHAERHRLGVDSMFTAVVTDGREWGFLISDEIKDDQLSLFTPPPADPLLRFVWQPNSVASCRRFLELVGSHPKVPVSGSSLSMAFGRGSDIARHTISILLDVLVNRNPNDKSDTLYKEWRRALEVAYGELDRIETENYGINEAFGLASRGTLGEIIFVLHTYFALIARLVALEILSISIGKQNSRPSLWSSSNDTMLNGRLSKLEKGELPEDISVSNFLEGDVFSWYLSHTKTNVSLLNTIRSICGILDDFAFPRLAYGATHAVDIFRDLYQRLTTRELRGALGEFLTPNWLAEATIDMATESGANILTNRVLDPACGTGTFLSPIISFRLRTYRSMHGNNPLSTDVQKILNEVVGIDINPVAVIAARMNYLISLGELALLGELRIPIWLADSILLPQEQQSTQYDFIDSHPELSGARFVELITSLDRPFVLPTECLNQDILSRVCEYINKSISVGANIDNFMHSLEQVMGPSSAEPIIHQSDEWDNAQKVLRFLYEHISDLNYEGRNGVWTKIIQNRFAPLFLEPFDLVIGNPPWLTFTKLPTNWREMAEPIWRQYGMYESPRIPGIEEPRSLHTSDMAVLFVAVSMHRYLKAGGILAFVAPKSLINGDPGNRAFRNYRLLSEKGDHIRQQVNIPFAIHKIDDYSEVRPFSPDASNTPIILVLKSYADNQMPISGVRWSRLGHREQIPDKSWEVIKNGYLRKTDVRWEPISDYGASPLAWWLHDETSMRGAMSTYTYGKGADTRGANGILLLELRGRLSSTGLIRVANQPDLGRDKELRESGAHIGLIEAELIAPIVRGRDIRPFSYRPSCYLLLAHDPSARSRILSLRELSSRKGAHLFLMNFRKRLQARRPYLGFRPSEECWWQIQGVDHMDSGFFVCVSEISQAPAAVVVRADWDDNLGRVVLPIPDHKLSFFNTNNEDEAYYLAGMLNSDSIQILIKRYANFIAISPATLRYLPIPKYDSHNDIHCKISSLSKEVHSGDEKRNHLVKQLNRFCSKTLSN